MCGERNKKGIESGFTLLELLLVLVILSVLVAVQLPNLVNFASDSSLEADARVMRMVMLTARMQAVQQRREMRLVIDLDGKGYGVEYQVDPVNSPQDFARPNSGALARQYKFTSGFRLTIEPHQDFIRFGPDGINQEAVLRLSNDEGEEAILQLEPSNHRISLEYGAPNA